MIFCGAKKEPPSDATAVLFYLHLGQSLFLDRVDCCVVVVFSTISVVVVVSASVEVVASVVSVAVVDSVVSVEVDSVDSVVSVVTVTSVEVVDSVDSVDSVASFLTVMGWVRLSPGITSLKFVNRSLRSLTEGVMGKTAQRKAPRPQTGRLG